MDACIWHRNCFNIHGDLHMENERRYETRLEKRLLVNISKDDGYESMGLTANISKQGMFIATPEIIPLNSEVLIMMGIADETFTLKGVVIWSHEWRDASSSDVQAAIGIRIVDPPEQYIAYLDRVDSQSN